MWQEKVFWSERIRGCYWGVLHGVCWWTEKHADHMVHAVKWLTRCWFLEKSDCRLSCGLSGCLKSLDGRRWSKDVILLTGPWRNWVWQPGQAVSAWDDQTRVLGWNASQGQSTSGKKCFLSELFSVQVSDIAIDPLAFCCCCCCCRLSPDGAVACEKNPFNLYNPKPVWKCCISARISKTLHVWPFLCSSFQSVFCSSTLTSLWWDWISSPWGPHLKALYNLSWLW